MNSVISVLNKRRSRYALKNEITMTNEELKQMIEGIVSAMPSAMNSQSTRIVVLLNKDHDKLWDITLDELKKVASPDQFPETEQKVNGAFKSGYGTILFFEDNTTVKSLEEQFPSYAHNFPNWSMQTNGMHQIAIWSALAEEGIGASLQHYNELIDESVRKTWPIPSEWKLVAQMPFGIMQDQVGEKETIPVEKRVVFFQ